MALCMGITRTHGTGNCITKHLIVYNLIKITTGHMLSEENPLSHLRRNVMNKSAKCMGNQQDDAMRKKWFNKSRNIERYKERNKIRKRDGTVEKEA
jgi:hypothetical protein